MRKTINDLIVLEVQNPLEFEKLDSKERVIFQNLKMY